MKICGILISKEKSTRFPGKKRWELTKLGKQYLYEVYVKDRDW